VLDALPERRYRNREHVEPLEQILTERSILNRFFQIPVRGRDDADIYLDWLGAPEPLDHPFLEDTEQLYLDIRGELSNLIEEERGVVGGLEPADLTHPGAGEGAALMSKELAFDERARNRGAADANHLALSLRAHLVNRLGEEFFPDT